MHNLDTVLTLCDHSLDNSTMGIWKLYIHRDCRIWYVYTQVKQGETSGIGDEISMTSMPSCAKQTQVKAGEAGGRGVREITLTNYPPAAS